jgi:regulator of sirC expression with transglutaminase-like and TPR domain
MKRDDKESIAIWAARPEVWAEEPQRVHLKYGAAVEEARKALAKKEDTPKTEAKPSKKKANS